MGSSSELFDHLETLVNLGADYFPTNLPYKTLSIKNPGEDGP